MLLNCLLVDVVDKLNVVKPEYGVFYESVLPKSIFDETHFEICGYVNNQVVICMERKVYG